MNMHKMTLTVVMALGLSMTGLPVAAEESADGHGDSAVRSGKEISQTCAACHGAKGISASEGFPHLAGQHESYLIQALTDYKTGKRQHQIMNQMAGTLSRAEIEAVSAYYADMPGGLVTPPRTPAED